MILQPGQSAPLVRQLGMPGDVSTYYVQAVVKNSKTATVIATINLTDTGNQRFTGSLDVPQDVLGFGYYIDITTTVYTDAGYTAISDLYTVENNPYLVFDRLTLGRNTSGAGASMVDNVDYLRIKKMLDKAVESLKEKETESSEEENVDLTPVLEKIDSVESRLSSELARGFSKTKEETIIKLIEKFSKEVLSKINEKSIVAQLEKLVNRLESVVSNEMSISTNYIKESREDVDKVIGASVDVQNSVSGVIQEIKSLTETLAKGTDEEKNKEIQNSMKELGKELTEAFNKGFTTTEDSGKTLVQALVSMSKSSGENKKKEDMKSPYIDVANTLLE